MFSVLYSESGNFAVLNIPKCGSQTLRATELANVDLEQSRMFEDRLAFIRHPVDRIKSAYRFFMDHRWLLSEDIDSYESFIDYTFEIDDEHWKPMVDFIFPYGDCIVKEIHSLCRMQDVLKGRLGYKIPICNESNTVYRTSDYRLDELLIKYQKDLELYNGLR